MLYNQMANAGKKYPDFFKVFLPKQHYERMLMPNAFVKLARSQGRVALDVIILRDRGGRVWHIRTRAIGDQLYFEGGWKRFREDNCLEADFIVFSHVENNVFKFKILEGSSRCEKIIKERGDDIMEEEEEEQEQDYCRACKARSSSGTKAADAELEEYEIDAEMYTQQGNPNFVTKIITYRRNELRVPHNIIKDFSLSFPQQITLLCCQCKYIERNEVEDFHLNLAQNVPNMTKRQVQGRGQVGTWGDGRVRVLGWAEFCRKSKIKENDACICEIVMREDKTIEMLRVHVVRKE